MQKTGRQARTRELSQKLAQLPPDQRQALIDRGLIATVEGRMLSLHNTLMVYMQIPGIFGGNGCKLPSVVGGFKQWKAAGRQVQKGQHGYTILFPVGDKDKETGDIIHAERYFTATVFDIGQTEEIKEEGII